MKSLYDEVVPILNQEYPGVKEWKSFAMWWLLAHGLDYRGQEKDYLVDGSGDGGFDVLSWPLPGFNEDAIHIIQSKYYRNPPTLAQIERFLEAIDAVSGSRKEYDLWLDTVNDNLRITYENVRARYFKGKVRFIFISTATLSVAARSALKARDVEIYEKDEVRRLLRFFIKGQTPRVEALTITPTSKLVRITKTAKVDMHVFSVHMRDFARAYKQYGNLLFAGNIRYGGVKGANAAIVRNGIDDTLTEHDDEFVFSHNGITVVCQDIKRVSKKKIKMFEPSVVNGAQTITYVGQKWQHKIDSTDAEVLVKLIKVQPDASFEELETDIAVRSNTQIKVDLSDLIVTEPALVTLQKHLMRKRIHLERKKAEQTPFATAIKIKKERLVQVFSCLDSSLGPTAPKKLQELFKKHDAVDLLRSYETRIPDVVALVWLDWLVLQTIRTFGKKASIKRAKTASFAIFAAVAKALQKAHVWNKVVNEVYGGENYHDYERNESISELIIDCRNYMLTQSAKQKKNEPAFYKNKSETDNLVAKTIKKFSKSAAKACN